MRGSFVRPRVARILATIVTAIAIAIAIAIGAAGCASSPGLWPDGPWPDGARASDLPPVGPGVPGGLHADAAFEWIVRLDPDTRTTGDAPRGVARAVPAGFVATQTTRIVDAISESGSVYRVGSVANEPRARASFWAQALAHHLGPRYSHVDVIIVGGYHGVVLTGGGDARVYAILIAVSRNAVIVVEAIYPDSAVAEIDHAAVVEFLSGVAR